jgi:hypothetical protein
MRERLDPARHSQRPPTSALVKTINFSDSPTARPSRHDR